MERKSHALAGSRAGLLLVLLLAAAVRADDAPKYSPVPTNMCAKLEALFQKYYPKASFTNEQINGLRFECEVTTYEFPDPSANDPTKGNKRESTIQRGPKKGGIMCGITQNPGHYDGQLAMPLVRWRNEFVTMPESDWRYWQVEPQVVERHYYKILLMAPYSPKRDTCLWVALSYPPDASDNFLKELRALMLNYEQDID